MKDESFLGVWIPQTLKEELIADLKSARAVGNVGLPGSLRAAVIEALNGYLPRLRQRIAQRWEAQRLDQPIIDPVAQYDSGPVATAETFDTALQFRPGGLGRIE